MRDADVMLAEGVRGRFDKVSQHVIIGCRLYGDAGVKCVAVNENEESNRLVWNGRDEDERDRNPGEVNWRGWTSALALYGSEKKAATCCAVARRG
jgi:hypothetical protein